MSRNRGISKKLVVALAASSLLLPASVVIAAPGQKSNRAPAISLSFDTGFTPAQADPRLAAALASRPALASDFKFTPAASKGRPSQIRVAIRARTSSPSQALRTRELASQSAAAGVTLAPASYNLGVGVGWKRFAVSGDVARSREASPALGGREGATIGVSYDLKRFTGQRPPALRDAESYALDLGGAFNISRNIAVTGGVRYKIERERLATIRDQRQDSQAVYVGTALKF